MMTMKRYVLVGNSGSGKSTLAARLAQGAGAAHLDLDTLAWTGATPPTRRPVDDSARAITSFMDAHDAPHVRAGWVIEGCYADLVVFAAARATRLIFLNPGREACLANARARPWEPHKYASEEEQDASLHFLLGWICDYETRSDVFSLAQHRALFDAFAGEKLELTSREEIAAFTG
jgi:adenylate kinase family enzyme